MKYKQSLTGEAAALKKRLKCGATVTNGAVVVQDGSGPGEVIHATATAAADAYGVAAEGATYSATQGAAEAVVDVIVNPLGVFGGQVTGGTTNANDVALSIVTNDAVDTTGKVIGDTTNFPADTMTGAVIYGLTGANVGQSRIATASVASDSMQTTVPFLNDIAADDTFLVFASSKVAQNVTISTTFDQVSQFYESGSGIPAAVVDIIVDDWDVSAPQAKVLFVLRDHVFNPLS